MSCHQCEISEPLISLCADWNEKSYAAKSNSLDRFKTKSETEELEKKQRDALERLKRISETEKKDKKKRDALEIAEKDHDLNDDEMREEDKEKEFVEIDKPRPCSYSSEIDWSGEEPKNTIVVKAPPSHTNFSTQPVEYNGITSVSKKLHKNMCNALECVVTCYCCRSALAAAVKPDIDDGASITTFKKLDIFTRFVMGIAPNTILKQKEYPFTSDHIRTEETDLGWKKDGGGFSDWKKKLAKVTTIKVSDSFSVDIIKDDDLTGNATIIESISNWFISSRCIWPLVDNPDLFFASNKEAQKLLDNLKLTMGEVLPNSYNEWDDMTNDESLTRIFFYGMGAVLVAAQSNKVKSDFGPFVVEMPLENFKTRRGFRPLGATIHFDINQKPTAIYDHYRMKIFYPGKTGWEEAKFLVRVTVATLVTAREHLIWSHLIMSNAVTKASINHLPPCHPIRRLLTIFTFRTNHVNRTAFGTLIPELGILHRATGFTYKSLQDIFDTSYKASNIFEPFSDRKVCPAVQKLSDEGKFPYLSEGMAYYKIVHAFVQEWLNAAANSKTVNTAAKDFYNAVKEDSKDQMYELPEFMEGGEMLVNLLSQMIFVVTAYHELAGGVVDYFRLPTRFGFRCTENATQMDVQSFLLTTIIAGSTSIRMPFLMRDFKNFFGAGGAPAWEKNVWNNFWGELKIQSKMVNEADAIRRIKYKAFDPANFECSISV